MDDQDASISEKPFHGCTRKTDDLTALTNKENETCASDFRENMLIKPGFSAFERFIYIMSCILLTILFPILRFVQAKIVRNHERAIFLRFGRVILDSTMSKPQIFGPGIYLCLPGVDHIRKVSIRPLLTDFILNSQISKDGVPMRIGVGVTYRVCDSLANMMHEDRETSQLRRIIVSEVNGQVGNYSMRDLMADTEKIEKETLAAIKAPIRRYGYEVQHICVESVQPEFEDWQRLLAGAQLESLKANASDTIDTEGELAALGELRKAADILVNASGAQRATNGEELDEVAQLALYLRRMEAFKAAAKQESTSVEIIPLPMETLADMAAHIF